MAKLNLRLPQNTLGDFYVDSSCIDCDACRQIAPETFTEYRDLSIVQRQPETDEQRKRALMALVACPTASIGTTITHDFRAGIDAFPSLIAEDVYFCGFTSESSFGAWSYPIVRPAARGGNVLVDSPRFATQLVKRIKDMGGVSKMFLTHRDDVADHARFADVLGCERLMHVDDGAKRLGIEHAIQGEEELAWDDELVVIPTPGHTRGHMVLLYRNRVSFHRRSSGVVTGARNTDGFSQRGMVFLARTNAVNGKAPAPSLRVGAARPRANSSRKYRRNARTSGELHHLDES